MNSAPIFERFEVSRERLAQLFVELARIPSPSRNEREVADSVGDFLRNLGYVVYEDAAGRDVNGNTGNLYCLVGRDLEQPKIAIVAHLDTVAPAGPIKPVLGDDGVFRNGLPTILGADDKAAIAAILHATEILARSGESFPPYELIFTVCEEIGLLGSRHLTTEVPRSCMAVALDSSGPVGGVIVRAPSHKSLKATFRGVAAHAGLDPENGRNAILAASRAVAAMRLGRLDDETTANVGVIRGGVASNIVPDLCELEGECRSHNEEKLARIAAEMVDAVHVAAAQTGVDVDVHLEHEYSAFALDADCPTVGLACAAIRAAGLEPQLLTGGGGSDANVLNARGIPTVNLSAGMMRVHSPEEHVSLDELERLCRVVVGLIVLPAVNPQNI
ncbi:MAG: M20/M25/M40 family metallo-hydrolase [Thermoleophilia bacterium]|nr:M20/M25/M40 family metallo-hydrolase [Thermoleophilia bacterium]